MGMTWQGDPTPSEPRAVLGSGEPRKSLPLWVYILGAAGCVLVCVLIAWLNTLAVSK